MTKLPTGALRAPLLVFTFFCVLPVSAMGQEVAPRIMQVPGPDHTGPRITIQVTAEDMERQRAALGEILPPNTITTEAEPLAELPEVESDSASSWFWDVVSPSMPASPTRFWDAQDILASAPEVAALGAPRFGTISQIAQEHGRAILGATVGTQISPAFVLAVIAAESSGRSDAESGAGAQGLMQLIPDTAERFGVTDPFDPAQNIAGGVAYLDWLMERFDRDPLLVLAAYNAGEGAVSRAGGVPNYDETRTYVPRVLAAWTLARSLCTTPPDLVSDGCVFSNM